MRDYYRRISPRYVLADGRPDEVGVTGKTPQQTPELMLGSSSRVDHWRPVEEPPRISYSVSAPYRAATTRSVSRSWRARRA